MKLQLPLLNKCGPTSTTVDGLVPYVLLVDYDLQYNGNTIVSPPVVYENFPYFLNSQEDIAEGNQDLIIMPGDLPNDLTIRFTIQDKTETDDGQGGIIESWHNLFDPLNLNYRSAYYVGVDDSGVGFYYSIPWDFFKDYIKIGNQYNYVLAYTIDGEDIVDNLYITYGGLTPEDALKNALDEQTNIMNYQSNLFLQQIEQLQDILSGQQQTTASVEHLEDTITDSNIESGASDLPSISVDDPSNNGINNIFQSIYNAFCTGQAQNIVFPIPFTNKNITLSPYYVRDMLNNNGAGWVYTLIQVFWGYLIGRFIVKDVSHKITKIKSGDVENIENNNIKEEML